MGTPTTGHGNGPGRARTASPTAPPPAALEAVRSLARASRLLERAAGALGMAQYRVLSAIAAGDERASLVAKRFGLGRPTVSVAVDALCRQGLLAREDAPGDHRATDLSITPKGSALLSEVEAAMVGVLGDLCDRAPTGGSVTSALAALGPALDALQVERAQRRRPART